MARVRFLGIGSVALILLFGVASAAFGQKWAAEMFDNDTSHDFGTVARGAKAEHRFKIENIYVEDAHIKSVQASCQCAQAQITKQSLKTWDTSEIVVTMDTRGFLGRHDATIKVTFDQPFPAEVQLQVHCNIRSDVVVQPGIVEFGTVAQGVGGQQKVSISYAGRGDWKIRTVESANPNLSARAVERARVAGRVDYDLLVALKDTAPAGYIRDDLILVTDDANPQAARVPVPVEARIQAAITVYPSPFLMGSVAAGETITRPLVLHGNAPFRIVRVNSSDPRFKCVPPDGAASLHRIPVTFTADDKSGPASAKISIETDSEAGRKLDVAVSVEVSAKAGKKAGE